MAACTALPTGNRPQHHQRQRDSPPNRRPHTRLVRVQSQIRPHHIRRGHLRILGRHTERLVMRETLRRNVRPNLLMEENKRRRERRVFRVDAPFAIAFAIVSYLFLGVDQPALGIQNRVRRDNLRTRPLDCVDLFANEREREWHEAQGETVARPLIPRDKVVNHPHARIILHIFLCSAAIAILAPKPLGCSLYERILRTFELVTRAKEAIVYGGKMLEVAVEPDFLDTSGNVREEVGECCLGEILCGDAGDQDRVGLGRCGMRAVDKMVLASGHKVAQLRIKDVTDVT